MKKNLHLLLRSAKQVSIARSSLNWLDLSPRETRSNLFKKKKKIKKKKRLPIKEKNIVIKSRKFRNLLVLKFFRRTAG
jgi:hypothetical protein